MGLEDWTVDVEKGLDKMEDISEELEVNKNRSIFRIPDYISELDNKAYKPQVVSLGPYHHGEQHLKPMEEHKNRVLLHFLKRSRIPLRHYLDALAQEVNYLNDAYDQLDPMWQADHEKFLQLMIIDGCFIIEILRAGEYDYRNDYAREDPIFSYRGYLRTMPLIKRDMLLLENQVPLRVLEILVAVEGGRDITVRTGDYDLIKRILKLFNLDTRSQSVDNGLHVLDLCRRGLVVSTMDRNKSMIESEYDIIISATELHEAGIRFKTSKTKSLKDISFKGSTLFLPPIVVDTNAKSLFLNLMAFERLQVGAGTDVTSYVYFMRSLITSGKDVSLLRSLDIVHTGFGGSDEDVAQLFRSISRDAVIDPESALIEIHFQVAKKVRNHFRKKFSVWRMDLLLKFLKSASGVMSVCSAIILFTLTTIQTVYTVMSYHHTN